MRRGRVTEMRPARWLVWWVTAIHGHLHVHVVVVNVHARTVAKQTRVHYEREITRQIVLIMTLFQ